MNDKLHTYLKKTGEEISLSREERARMRKMLHSYMEMKPVRIAASPSSTTILGWFFTLRPVALVLVFALFVSSTGISYAAEAALPGDLLYPIKRHVNEPIAGALAISASGKSRWAMNVAGKRVQEAATLAAEGRLSTSTQHELQENFETHAQTATENISEELRSSPEAGAESALRFEATLSEYGNVLVQVGSAKHINVAPFAESVKHETKNISALRARAQLHVNSTTGEHRTATRIRTAARAQFDSSTELAKGVGKSISSSSAETIAAQLESARSRISSGEHFVDTDAIPDAIGAFQDALSATEKVRAFLETTSAIHARTGFVVGEQKDVETDHSSQQINKNDQPIHTKREIPGQIQTDE